jgi:hypothetical protein
LVFYSEELLALTQPQSWRTIYYQLSATAYSVYSQPPSISGGHILHLDLTPDHIQETLNCQDIYGRLNAVGISTGVNYTQRCIVVLNYTQIKHSTQNFATDIFILLLDKFNSCILLYFAGGCILSK